MSGITIATKSSEFEANVRSAFGGRLNGDLRRWFSQAGLEDPVAAVEEIAATDPEVVALGPDLPLQVTFDMARELERLRPEITVLIVAPPSAEVWENALRAGARDVIAPDAVAEQLLETFDRALQTGTRLRANLAGTETPAASQSRLITVLSPKGGSGKTVVASNLAVGLAKRHPGQVVLVDLDILFGDAANALMLVPDQTLADVARSLHTLDATTLKMFLTPHASDLYVMCAPETPSEGEGGERQPGGADPGAAGPGVLLRRGGHRRRDRRAHPRRPRPFHRPAAGGRHGRVGGARAPQGARPARQALRHRSRSVTWCSTGPTAGWGWTATTSSPPWGSTSR